jgi:pyrroloquinoline quinone biosynthesis protein E
VEYLPIKLDIENISRCNFRCTMCVVSDWEKGKRGEDMSLEEFQRLIDEQYGLVEIKLQGIGEPTMQGDVFFEMIKYARARHIWVRTTTNASLLHVKDKLPETGGYRRQRNPNLNRWRRRNDVRVDSTWVPIRESHRKLQTDQRLLPREGREAYEDVDRRTARQPASMEDLVHLAHEAGFTNQVFSLN